MDNNQNTIQTNVEQTNAEQTNAEQTIVKPKIKRTRKPKAETQVNTNEVQVNVQEDGVEGGGFIPDVIETNFHLNLDQLDKLVLENEYKVPVNYKRYSIEHEPLRVDDMNTFDELGKNISTYGTIEPAGKYIDTPPNIKLVLKLHQKRTLYEMYIREIYNKRITAENTLLLCDNVGSGKSLCMLSLIAARPEVDSTPQNIHFMPKNIPQNLKYKYELMGVTYNKDIIELKSNLIIVPHGIFNQWKDYIKSYTNLSFFSIGMVKDIYKLGIAKKEIVENLNKYNIILVKATMFTHFSVFLTQNGLSQTREKTYNNHVEKDKDIDFEPTEIIDYIHNHLRDLKHQYLVNHNYDYIDDFIATILDYRQTLPLEEFKKINKGIEQYCKSSYRIDGVVFQRTIVDEADSIKIPNCPMMYGKMNWLITSSINNLLYPRSKREYDDQAHKYKQVANGMAGTGFIRDMVCNMTQGGGDNSTQNKCRVANAIIRGNYDFIQDSIKIPDPIVGFIKCFTPPELLAVANAVNPEALQALNAGDMETAIKLLGVEGNTEEDLVQIVNKQLYKKRDELKDTLDEKNKLLANNAEAQEMLKNNIDHMPKNHIDLENLKKELAHLKGLASSYKSSIDNFTNQLKDAESKIAGVEARITGVKDKKCPICSDDITAPCLTPCCKNVFCLECISMAIKFSQDKSCPMCRNKLDLAKITIIVDANKDQVVDETADQDQTEVLPKLDTLLQFIKQNPGKKILVFSSYEKTFENIETEFAKNKITYSKLSGTAARINNIINKYKSGECQVLLLNAKNFGAGLNLQITDEIVIYHRMSKDLERQVIGRAQRLGRMDPLKINYLCFENEYPTGYA